MPPAAREDSANPGPLRLEIGPVVACAERIAERVRQELPTHAGLARASQGVAAAAREAQRVARRLRRPLGLHRVPPLFLVLSLGLLGGWVYWHFFHVSRMLVAVSARDAVQLKGDLGPRFRMVPVETRGSQESVDLLLRRQVQLAFVQGGIELPQQLLRAELESSELVLFYLRESLESPSQIRTLLTSEEGQGSHTLARTFLQCWGIDQSVRFVHTWRTLTEEPAAPIGDEIDAVFVVKDPMNVNSGRMATRLYEAGFRLASPDIGSRSLLLPYLRETEIRAGFLDPLEHLPHEPVPSYRVTTYLVARPDLTPRELAAAASLIQRPDRLVTDGFQPTFNRTMEVLQGVEAVLNIVVYIGLAFLFLLGLDIVAYRRRFNELNSLVSLISMHQGEKDVLGSTAEVRAHNVQYLSVCSDLLGLISVITGYYAQENAGLMYNRLFEIIHDRCSGLKINIQLKILHALVEMPELGARLEIERRPATPPDPVPDGPQPDVEASA